MTFWYPILILVLLVILTRSRSAWFRRNTGERVVRRLAKRYLDKNTYHIVHDVTLPTDDGTTQIDHIIVSVYGVFVIETKNLTGWIFGDKKQRQWTQVIYGHKTRFQNPLHQNYKHVKTLQKLLSLHDNQMHSVVVFVGGSTFKTAMPINVTQGLDFITYVKSLKAPVVSEQQVTEALIIIESVRLDRSFKTNREHLKHVKSIVKEKEKLDKTY